VTGKGIKLEGEKMRKAKGCKFYKSNYYSVWGGCKRPGAKSACLYKYLDQCPYGERRYKKKAYPKVDPSYTALTLKKMAGKDAHEKHRSFCDTLSAKGEKQDTGVHMKDSEGSQEKKEGIL